MTIRITQEALARKWTKEEFSCGLWVDPPGQRWENYVHEVDEVVCVAEGALELEMEGKKRILKPGDKAFIPARTNHSVRNVGRRAARWYYGYKRT